MAKIIGNIVGLPSPRSDWNQNDEMKADFIKNRPLEAIKATERVLYYGDINIVPSDESFFIFDYNESALTASVGASHFSELPTNTVIPYSVVKDGATYRVTQISLNAFQGSGFESVILPSGILAIGVGAFTLSNIKKIVIPKSVKIIGVSAFDSCGYLTDIYYEGSEEDWNSISIGSGAIPEGVTIHYNKGESSGGYDDGKLSDIESTLGITKSKSDSVFQYCGGEDTFMYYGYTDITPSDKSLFNFTFDDSDKSASVAYVEPKSTSLESDIVIPYTAIKDEKAYSVTEVSRLGFQLVKGLNSVVLPNGIKAIRYGSFSQASLKKITIPKSVMIIERYAFYYADLTDIYYEGSEEDWSKITIETDVFGVNKTITIHYNYSMGTIQEYVDKKISELGELGGENVIVDTELSITSENPVQNKVITEKINGLGKHMENSLKYYGNLGITPTDEKWFGFTYDEENLTASVKGIKGSDFPEVLVIPYSTTKNGKTYSVTSTIPITDGESAFQGCIGFKKAILPNSILSIGSGLFLTTNVEEIIIPKSVTKIERFAFAYLTRHIDIYYEGSEEDWGKIEFGDDVFRGTNSYTIHYNSSNDLQEYVDEKLGDIETALDRIIEIQNSLIGGDGE